MMDKMQKLIDWLIKAARETDKLSIVSQKSGDRYNAQRYFGQHEGVRKALTKAMELNNEN